MLDGRRAARFAVGFVGGVIVGLMVFAVWLAVSGVGLGKDAAGLKATAAQIRAAVVAGDYNGASSLLEQARVQAESLDGRLSSPPWSWTQSFPVVGRTVASSAVLASAANQVLSQSDGLGAGLAAAAGGDAVTATAALQQTSPELAVISEAASSAVRAVSAIDTRGVLSQVRGQFATAQQEFLSAVGPVAQGAAVARVLPGMLGAEEPVRWLVLLGQPSEARGSGGGFLGAYLSVDVSGGQFAPGPASSNDFVAYVKQGIAQLPDEYERLWGSDASYLWGYNLTRHYPYAASIAHGALDPSADYVVSLDPAAVAGLMGISGPVTVDGVELNASNAEAFFARDIYVRYPDPVVKDRVMMAFLQQLFVQLGASRVDPTILWRALAPVVSSSHIQVWSPDASVQAPLERSLLGGAVPSLAGPWVTAAFNNTAGNKIDSHVSSSLSYVASGSCEAGVSGEVTARLELAPLPPGLPAYISGRVDELGQAYGTSSMYVHIYGPSGARGRTFEVNGLAVPAVMGSERGHPVWGAKVPLPPGVPVVVRATFDQPAFPGRALQVAAQPMVQDTAVTVTDQRSCGVG